MRMPISRQLAIQILKYLRNHTDFYFPFVVVCKEYSPEDDDFVEIEPEERKNIEDDEIYQTFELRENLQNLYKWSTELLAKWFIEKIIWKGLYEEVSFLMRQYKTLYKEKLCESEEIEEYWTNEFFWWKVEAYKDILELLEKYKL